MSVPINWETHAERDGQLPFSGCGGARSFWLRTKQGFLAEGFPLLRTALQETRSDATRRFAASNFGEQLPCCSS